MNRVVITGMSNHPLGNDVASFWEGLLKKVRTELLNYKF